MIDFTPAEERTLRQLLETVVTDQEHFLDGETDSGAIREATRAKRRAEQLLARLASRGGTPSARDATRGDRDELTREQLARQDAVDNAIHRLLNELMPSGLNEIPWCQSCLATVRYAVLKSLREHAAISNAQFYPALGDSASGQRVQIVSTRDENGDSETRLILMRTARKPRKRGVR